MAARSLPLFSCLPTPCSLSATLSADFPQGKWSSGEDTRLMELVEEKGRRWKEIGGALGRMPEACRDRWLAIRCGRCRAGQG